MYMGRMGKCPFDHDTLNKYLNIWDMLIMNEKAAEAIRQRLQNKYQLNISAAFEYCDYAKDGYISVSEVKIIFNSIDKITDE